MIPIVLGDARIYESNIHFLHVINTTVYLPIATGNLDNLDKIQNRIDLNINIEIINLFTTRLRTLRKESKTLIEAILTLRPKTRERRGIHIIFGDLIQADTEQINEALKTINTNENLIISKVNEQVEINTAMINRFREIENHINGEVELLTNHLNNNTRRLDDIETILTIEQYLHAIEYTIRNLQQHINEILDSISFAKQGYISHYLLSKEESTFIYDNLKSQKININSEHELYQFITVNTVFKHPLVVFTVSIPQYSAIIYKHIQLFPLTINDSYTLQIPYKFISISNKIAKYSNEPCNNINGTYFCKQEELHTSTEKCIEEIITNQPSKCNLIEGNIKPYITHIEKQFIIVNQQIMPTYYTNCNNQVTKTLPKQCLIKINNCTITINNKTYANTDKQFSETYSYIPYNDIIVINKTKSIEIAKLSNITITNMHKLNYVQQTSIPQQHHYSAWGITSILVTSIIIYLCILRYCPSCTPCQWYSKIKNSSDFKALQQTLKKQSETGFTEDSENLMMEELHNPLHYTPTTTTPHIIPTTTAHNNNHTRETVFPRIAPHHQNTIKS